jgi:ATP-dependent Clp endopeptidase proteolytic subunit ClpP
MPRVRRSLQSHAPLDELKLSALERGVDLQGRRIFLHGEVDEETVGAAVRGLFVMADQSNESIELIISSYGGSVDLSFALHDVMRAIKPAVHATAIGMCQSAAPFLLACAEKGYRFASANCEFMVHTASFGMDGAIINVQGTAAAMKRRMERMDRLLAEYSKMPYRHWSSFNRSGNDHYFGTKEALKWGLIDGIWQ